MQPKSFFRQFLAFGRAMELQSPHNYFTPWMVTPTKVLAGARPVDRLKGGPAPLLRALESFRGASTDS